MAAPSSSPLAYKRRTNLSSQRRHSIFRSRPPGCTHIPLHTIAVRLRTAHTPPLCSIPRRRQAAHTSPRTRRRSARQRQPTSPTLALVIHFVNAIVVKQFIYSGELVHVVAVERLQRDRLHPLRRAERLQYPATPWPLMSKVKFSICVSFLICVRVSVA